jgi:hypothetical protein
MPAELLIEGKMSKAADVYRYGRVWKLRYWLASVVDTVWWRS